ncbi:MAG: electron transfer flavoprotein subunit alpha/FixB family protein [Sandaracinaceae bacterium]|jgi:electron transfer flavoprotein alpha subunit|nr:electron transfer flavoprotein subunit alpha/FixB family protein [Sandaracinaceae bacterium]
MTDVLVVAELLDGKMRKTTLSAITLAKKIADGTGGKFDVLSIGAGAKAAAAELATYGARKVFATEVAGGYIAEKFAPTVADLATKGAYGVVTATASTYGKDLMPRVGARLSAGVASDVSDVSTEGGKLVYKRPMYAGNVFGYVEVTTKVQVVSARQSEFEAAAPAGAASPIEDVAAVTDAAASRVEFMGLESVKSARPELAEASVVVSGGRALKSAENFKTVLEPLVDAMGAAMGASRAACDAGYVPNDLQVGQTGKVVAPKLYVAVGISGAIQHLAGMKGSKVIVAINKDKEAPIAQVADYFLVGDLFTVIPQLTEEVKKAKAAH